MARRRGKGGGTVYKHASGRWCAELSWINPVTGKRERITRYADTRKEAEGLLGELVAAKHRGTLAEPSRVTVLEWASGWLARQERAGKAANTLRCYRQELTHALPSLRDPKASDPLGRLRLQAVRPLHIRAVMDRLQEGGLAPRTQRKVLERLRALFREALRLEMIVRNPAEAVTLNLPPITPVARALEPQQLEALLKAAEDSKSPDMALFIRLVAETGMRRGEALALRWEDVNLEEAEVRVSRAWTKALEPTLTTPKTRAGRRVVPLSRGLLLRLQAYRARLLERLTEDELKGLYLFGGVKPYDPDAPNHYLKRLCKRLREEQADFPDIRVHDLRHTWASLALARRVPLELVSERLGHSSSSITLNIYRHVLQEERRGHVLELEDLLYGVNPARA